MPGAALPAAMFRPACMSSPPRFPITIAGLALALGACSSTSSGGSTGTSNGGSTTGAMAGSTAGSTGGSTTGGSPVCAPACGADQLCVAGSCVDLCTLVGQVSCDGGCADLRSDNANCGVCGTACGGGEGCVDAGCHTGLAACPTGYMTCDQLDGGFFCVDSSDDPENCGGCGVSCGTDLCRSGGCVCMDPLTPCPVDAGEDSPSDAGLTACADLTSDVNACGSCGHACISCELCSSSNCAPQNPLTRSGYLLTVDAGRSLLSAFALADGDVNGDGISDLVVLNLSTSGGAPTLGWSFGLSDGGFASFQFIDLSGILGSLTNSNQIVVADFNNDGFADVMLTYANPSASVVAAYLFTGSASGLAPRGTVWSVMGAVANGVGVGDVNSDGWQDLVVASGKAYVLLNQTDGGFAQAQAIANAPLTFNSRFAIADLNGDGFPDLFVPGNTGGTSIPQVTYQQSDGGFSPWVALAGDPGSTAAASYGSTVVVSTSDQIGLVTVTTDGGVVGNLSTAIVPTPNFVASAAVDLNHDGALDVVALGTSTLASFLRTPTGWDSSVLGLPSGTGMNFAVLADGRVVVAVPRLQQILIFDQGCPPLTP
jgi:hypothetical protein